jgi:hypothetical protein
MSREIRKLIKKVNELQKQLNQQNEYIMDQSIIIQKLIEKLVIIPSYPYTSSIDPHFGKDINMYGEIYPQYPFDTSS